MLGVQTQSMQDGWTRISVEIEPNGESVGIPTALGESLHSSGGTIRRFERVNPALEEIFQRLVRERSGDVSSERIEGASQ